MTAARRTLEEIEALAAEATPGPWTTKGKSVKAVGSPSTGTAPNGWQGGICNCMGSGHGPRSRIDELAENNAALIATLPDLLAIAQGQREEMERLRRYVRVLHEAIPELTDEMIDNACGPEIGPMYGIEAITHGMRTARRSGYRDGWSNCAYRLKQAKEIENPDRHQKVST